MRSTMIFWPLIDQLHARGILFCPASGRQYYGLLERFKPIAHELIFIAENGAYVMQKGIELSSDCLYRQAVQDLIPVCRNLEASETDIGTVLCGKNSAYVESKNPEFIAEVSKYSLRLERVEDLLAVEDDILKVAVFTFRSSEQVIFPAFEPVSKDPSGRRLRGTLAGHHGSAGQQRGRYPPHSGDAEHHTGSDDGVR